MVATVTRTAAGLALLLDVVDFAAGRDLAIAADQATAPERRETEKPDKTHRIQSSVEY